MSQIDQTINLYLVRHGESKQNVGINFEERIPDHAVELTEKGLTQADAAGQFLADLLKDEPKENIVMWRSPYQRTRQTSNGILRHVSVNKIKEDDMLVELQFGVFDNIPPERREEVLPEFYAYYKNARRFNGKFYARMPCGESPFDCEIRQKLWLESLYRDINKGNHPEHVIVVGHGAQLRLLRKAIFHYPHEWYADTKNPGNCSIVQVVLSPQKNMSRGYIYGTCEN